MLTTNFQKTQAFGHCLYLALHQLFIKFLKESNSVMNYTDTFNRLQLNINVSVWYNQAIEWNVPMYSLQLQHPIQQQHYRFWLRLLYSWLSGNNSRNLLARVLNYFDNAKGPAKVHLHSSLWGTDDFVGELHCPYPFYLLSKKPGTDHYVINQVYEPTYQTQFQATYTREQLIHVIRRRITV